MLRYYGSKRESSLDQLNIGGECPHCKKGAHFTPMSQPNTGQLEKDGVKEVVISYACDLCLRAIPVLWRVHGSSGGKTILKQAEIVLRSKEPFDFDHVPDEVRRPIEEALDCLSVSGFNGFAALCRRSIQAIATDLGARGSDRVKKQVEEMLEIADLTDEWGELAKAIMLTGHDGAHPHLPLVDADRAAVLLSLLRDLTYEVYTRPGKVKEAAALRAKAIDGSNAGA